jgi:prophage regulatory protein
MGSQHESSTQISVMPRLMRLPEVLRQTGLGRSSIYSYIKHGLFPGPIKIGLRASAWRSEEIGRWVEQRTQTFNPETIPSANKSL